MSGSKSVYPSRRGILRNAGLAIGAMAAPGLSLQQARAAGYPERTVKIIVPFAPAGPTDIMARIVSTHLGAAIGEGTIDWKTLLETYESVGGTEWYIVEHETGKVPLESVKTCLDNLHKMGR